MDRKIELHHSQSYDKQKNQKNYLSTFLMNIIFGKGGLKSVNNQ